MVDGATQGVGACDPSDIEPFGGLQHIVRAQVPLNPVVQQQVYGGNEVEPQCAGHFAQRNLPVSISR